MTRLTLQHLVHDPAAVRLVVLAVPASGEEGKHEELIGKVFDQVGKEPVGFIVGIDVAPLMKLFQFIDKKRRIVLELAIWKSEDRDHVGFNFGPSDGFARMSATQ